MAAGCIAPDQPPVEDTDLPQGAVEYLQPKSVSSYDLAPGVRYWGVRSAHEPWAVHLLEIDPVRCELAFEVVRSGDDEGRRSVSALARSVEPGVIAAVNGSFFTEENETLGVEVSRGEIRGRTARPVFAWRPGALPWVGPVSWEGDSLQVGEWWLEPGNPDGRTEVLPGFPALLREGRWVGDLEQGARPAFATSRDPRTAIGWDPDGAILWFVVVDGRRDKIEGMTLPELTELLRSLGVRDGVNLDGGGSSAMVVRGQLVSRPSDPWRERPVVNALVLREAPEHCEPTHP